MIVMGLFTYLKLYFPGRFQVVEQLFPSQLCFVGLSLDHKAILSCLLLVLQAGASKEAG